MTAFKAIYRATFYAPRSTDVTEATVLTPIGSAPHAEQCKIATRAVSGYQPYMMPPRGRSGRINPLTKVHEIGEITFEVLDPQLATKTKLYRWFTAYLGDAKGVNRILGCKVVIQVSADGGLTWDYFYTGRVINATLATKASFDVTVRDISYDLDKAEAFVETPHASVLAADMRAAITASDQTLTATTAQFASTDVGRVVRVAGAGPSGADLVTTVASYTSTTVVELTDAASKTVSNAKTTMGYVLEPLLLPVGLPAEYGPYPAAAALTGTTSTSPTINGVAYSVKLSSASKTRSDNLITEALLKVAPVLSAASGVGGVIAQAFAGGMNASFGGKPLSGVRARVKRLDTGAVGLFDVPGVSTRGGGGVGGALGGLLSSHVTEIGLTALDSGEAGYMALPPNSTSVEISLRRTRTPSLSETENEDDESTGGVIILKDVHPVQVWKDMLDGKFSLMFKVGEARPSGRVVGDPRRTYAYDAAAFATLIADKTIPTGRFVIPKRFIVSEFVQRHILQPYVLGVRVNGQGQIVPVDMRLPSSLVGTLTITEADVDHSRGASWGQPSDTAVTFIQVRHYTDLQLPADEVNDSIAGSTSLLLELKHMVEIVDFGRFDIDEQTHVIDAIGIRTSPNEKRDGLSGSDWGSATAAASALHYHSPFSTGALSVTMSCLRTANTDANLGDWRFVDVAWLPDPATNVRGGTRLMQCISRSDEGGFRVLEFLDAGPYAVAVAPTVGTLAAGTYTTSQINVPVTVNAQGDPVVVHMAIVATGEAQPAEASALWKFAFRTTASATVAVVNLPADMRVYFRARSEPSPVDATTTQSRLPSTWAFAATPYRETTGLTAPSAVSVAPATVLTTSTVTASWTNGDATRDVEVEVDPGTGVYAIATVLGAGSTSLVLNPYLTTGGGSPLSCNVRVRHRDAVSVSAWASAAFTVPTSFGGSTLATPSIAFS